MQKPIEIDLTSDADDKGGLDMEAPHPKGDNKFSEKNLKQESKPSPIPRVKRNITEFDWIQIDEDNQEIDYMKTFTDIHKHDYLQYKDLDIETLDPNYEQSNFRGNIIEKIMKSIAKDGTLKNRGGFDDYEMDETFVDDTNNPENAMMALNAITPAFVDFVCHSGGIESFKRSNYYIEKVSDAKKYQNQISTKKKSAKKSGKEAIKRKPEIPSRSIEEMKKVKKNNE